MQLSLKGVGLWSALVVLAGLPCEGAAVDGVGSELEPVNTAGYTMSAKEVSTLKVLLDNEVASTSKGHDSLLVRSAVRTTFVEVAKSYAGNQVAGDQAYLGKPLLLTGTIGAIHSGEGNGPYLTFTSSEGLTSPKAYFGAVDIQRVAALSKGQKLTLHCSGGGVVGDTAIVKACEFADDFAKRRVEEVTSEIQEFLAGSSPGSPLSMQMVMVALSIAGALPDTSTCFTDMSSCDADMAAVMKDKEALARSTQAVVEELKAAGVEVPMPKGR